MREGIAIRSAAIKEKGIKKGRFHEDLTEKTSENAPGYLT